MRKKRLKLPIKKIMGGVIAFLMISSILGIFATNYKEKPEIYNSYKFYPYNQGWFTYINNQQVGFSYLPKELESIPSVIDINLNTQKVYIIFDPEVKNISIEQPKQRLATFLQTKNIIVVPACSKEQGCQDDLPIKECGNIDVPAIYLKSGKKSQIYKEFMCYMVEGDTSLNLFKANEKLIYQLLGIM